MMKRKLTAVILALCMVVVADRIQQDFRLEDILRTIAYSTAWIAVELQKMREER